MVLTARKAQRARSRDGGPWLNAHADANGVALDAGARALAEDASERLRLPAREFARSLRVGRTAAMGELVLLTPGSYFPY